MPTLIPFLIPSEITWPEPPPLPLRRPNFRAHFPDPIISDEQIVSLHTYSGVQLYQFLPDNQFSLMWTRDLREVSRCELSVPSTLEFDRIPDIVPWVHWISVWTGDAESLLWTGPIQKVIADRHSMSISSRDISAFMSRTRTPITKRWDAADPSDIAAELWDGLISNHNLNVQPIVRPDPEGDRFDFDMKIDSQMFDAEMNHLVDIGLRWCVVSGIPILGPAPLDPFTALSENDFLGAGPQITRDGATSFNDILLRGADALSRARVEMAGLNLQTIVNVDNMFGVSNVDRATRQYARYTASIRDSLSLPNNTVLHPDAPVSIDQLIPSSRLVVEAYGLRTLMELEGIEVSSSTEGGTTVGVSLESVVALPELIKTAPVGSVRADIPL